MAVVQIIAGLYYTLGSVLLLKKLSGSEEYDVVLPTGGGRPKVEKPSATFGIKEFQAGLHGPERIPDSGWTGTDHGAWTVKIPWEVHLKRKRPPEELYDPDNSYWLEWTEMKVEQLWNQYAEMYIHMGITKDHLRAKIKPKKPLRKEIDFYLKGEWWDNNFTNQKIDDFTIMFHGREDFEEVTTVQMRQKNEPGHSGPVQLLENGAHVAASNPGTPVFFDMVYNPHAGVTTDWQFTYKMPLQLVPYNADDEDLARWFDYENPETVNLRLEGPISSPDEQELNYNWW